MVKKNYILLIIPRIIQLFLYFFQKSIFYLMKMNGFQTFHMKSKGKTQNYLEVSLKIDLGSCSKKILPSGS